MKKIIISIFLINSLVVSLLADEIKLLEGHSLHGETFNVGPRQSAYLMEGTGNIVFDVTTTAEQSRAFFLQGVGQLHGFWYFEAERSFRQAAVFDPECAMNYWGMAMAMANENNETRAREFLLLAFEKGKKTSPRELMYLNAYATRIGLPIVEKELEEFKQKKKDWVPKKIEKDRRAEYVDSLEKIILAYPEDIEAKAFLVFTLWSNSSAGIKINSNVAVDALAKQVLEKNPYHPVHHYLIHLWDKKKPEQALLSASRGGKSSPAIAHMWHMPGHIYSGLNRFVEAAWQQEASARTDHFHMMHDLVLPDQIFNFAHNNEWLIRNLVHLGRIDDAISLAKNMSELPRHPKYNNLDKNGSAKFGRDRLFMVLRTFEMWDEVLDLKDSNYLEDGESNLDKLEKNRLLGNAYFLSDNIAEGENQLKAAIELAKLIEDEAIKKEEKELAEKKKVEAEKKKAEPEKKEAEKKEASKKEEKTQARKKSREELLAKECIDELTILNLLCNNKLTVDDIKDKKIDPLDEWNKVLVYLKLSDFENALKITTKAYEDKSNKNKVIYSARHIYVLSLAGKKDEAKKVFDQLRENSQDIKLEVAPFQRLVNLAQEFGYPKDWRLPYKMPADFGERPILDSLGPFRWQPVKASEWSLPNHKGETVSLQNSTKERAVILIFYLGAKCLHCVEQLNAFAPMKEAFAKEGIDLIAVSLEDVKNLQSSVSNYSKDGTFPFPILSDEKMEIFKKYRCYDDFEKMPLHGTFLIDKRGFIRWQDISYEPFMNGKFLLKESLRLLQQPEQIIYGEKFKVSR